MRKAVLLFIVVALVLVLTVLPLASTAEAGDFWLNCTWGIPVSWWGYMGGPGYVNFTVYWQAKWGETGTQSWQRYLSSGWNNLWFYPSNSNYRITRLKANGWLLLEDYAAARVDRQPLSQGNR
jgi:hypothetical protein